MEYFRLEYSEKQGVFQINSFSKRKDNLYDWETIAMVISREEVDKFISLVIAKYPQVNSGKGEVFPPVQEIKNFYNLFIGISEL